MKKNKIEIVIENGNRIEAQSPIIVSASRSTDIPAFYSDWFIERLKKGYVRWKNPFNGQPLYVAFENTRLVVFWSKNPKPMLKHIDYLVERDINFYFQYTLNDYDIEKLEPNVHNVTSRIETFQRLSERIGKEKVIWRFDPLILTDKIGVDDLLKKVDNVGSQLKGYTDKMVFSFADIKNYKKVQGNLTKSGINFREFDKETMLQFATGLQQLNKTWNYEIGTCAETIPLEPFGIIHNKCVDDDLMIKLFPHDKVLMDFLGVRISQPSIFEPDLKIEKTKNNKDKGQRALCGCIVSKDIGEYNTCPHFCEYCYANTSRKLVKANYNQHNVNPLGETISGD